MSRSSVYKEKVDLLRRQNKSYDEISKETGIAKSTLSDWLSSKDWSIKIKEELSKTTKLNILRANEVRLAQKKMRDKKHIEDARKEYKILKHSQLFVYGLGIYWGEGDKKDRNRVAITNTDPNMLRIVAKFYRNCLKIEEDKLRVELFLYDDINVATAINFWSDLLSIDTNQFIKTQILKSRAKLTKTKSKYGICTIYFSNTERSIKILEWIRLLSLDLRV